MQLRERSQSLTTFSVPPNCKIYFQKYNTEWNEVIEVNAMEEILDKNKLVVSWLRRKMTQRKRYIYNL